MTGPLTARLRVDRSLRQGRKVPQHLYAQLGDEPDDADPSIGWAKTAEHARIACAAVTDGQPLPGARWRCSGGLIYTGRPIRLTADWDLAVISDEWALRIVTAINGQVDDA
jgi:hypothetical protein